MTTSPTVVWVTMESTRADHTSLYGADRDTTPNLRRIARADRGRAFEACHTHGIWTLPSSASILTGTYPSRHGAGMGSEAIPADLPTVPEAFREEGYRTAGLSTNFNCSEAVGLDRGFDRFGWLSRDTLLDVAGPVTVGKYLLNLRRHSAGLTTDTRRHSTSYLVTDVLERWTGDLAGDEEPFFLYAHYGDPHRPYCPPLPWQDRFLDGLDVTPAEAQETALDHHENHHQRIADGCPFSDRELAAVRAMYDAEIAYTDALVGRLFDHVREAVDDLVFVVTADHGELFGEQGMLAHKVVVDDAVTHVPLVVYGLDELLEYDGETVQHADVFQTVLASIGHEFESGQGKDLATDTREHCLTQRGGERTERNLERCRSLNAAFEDDRYHRGPLSALRTPEYKYLRSPDRSELFALPDETTDVTDDHPSVARDLDDRLTDVLDDIGHPEDRPQASRPDGAYSDAMREQLADLGYLE